MLMLYMFHHCNNFIQARRNVDNFWYIRGHKYTHLRLQARHVFVGSRIQFRAPYSTDRLRRSEEKIHTTWLYMKDRPRQHCANPYSSRLYTGHDYGACVKCRSAHPRSSLGVSCSASPSFTIWCYATSIQTPRGLPRYYASLVERHIHVCI